MLTMDDIKYIKRMHDCEGTSIREIMRRTGYHFETVKKYLDQNDFNELHYPTREIPSLLDPLKPIIEEWLTEDLKAPRKQRHTAKRIYARLQKEYPNLLEVKLRTVQYYVSQKRTKIYAFLQDAYLPLYHAPGGSQVDFCHFAYYDNSQVMQDGLKLTMSFPYSNAAYCQIFRSENQECLLQGIKNIIEHMGCVPNRMVFDNLSAAVAHMGKGHDRVLTDVFKRYVTHYGIEPFFCNGAAGWEKGNVENKVGYERRNMFVPVPTILDFDEFNKRLFELSGEDCDREHYVKRERMDVLFKEDRNAMYPLNPVAFEVCRFESRIADKYGKISYVRLHRSLNNRSLVVGGCIRAFPAFKGSLGDIQHLAGHMKITAILPRQLLRESRYTLKLQAIWYKLSELDSYIKSQYKNINGIVIVKDGSIVYENYYNGYKESDVHHVASVS